MVLGYHGCDRSVGEKLLAGAAFLPSAKRHDWLGPGVYFWENDPLRALEWAQESQVRGKVTEPYVVGAVIAMGKCLDLTTRGDLRLLAEAYEAFSNMASAAELPIPQNEPIPNAPSSDEKLMRYLDCAVINFMHNEIAMESRDSQRDPHASPVEPFTTVRGLFVEGKPAYPGGGFYSKTHGQIAVCDPAAIRGVFIPRPLLPAVPD